MILDDIDAFEAQFALNPILDRAVDSALFVRDLVHDYLTDVVGERYVKVRQRVHRRVRESVFNRMELPQ